MDLAGSEKFQIPKSLSKEEYDMRIAELTTINGVRIIIISIFITIIIIRA